MKGIFIQLSQLMLDICLPDPKIECFKVIALWLTWRTDIRKT